MIPTGVFVDNCNVPIAGKRVNHELKQGLNVDDD